MPSDECISPISSIDKNSTSDSTVSQFNVRSTTSETTIRQIDDKAKVTKGPRGRILTTDEKLQRRLIANRKSAAASRSRRLNLIEELQKTVLEMSAKIEHLKRENYELRRELQMPPSEETFGGGPAAQGNNNVGHQGLMHLSPRGVYQPYIYPGSTSQYPSASQHVEGSDSFRGSTMQQPPPHGAPILLQDNIHGQQKQQHGYYAVSRIYPGEVMPSPSPFANSAPPSQQQQQQQQHALTLTGPSDPLTGPIHSQQQGPPPPTGHFSSKTKGGRAGRQQEAV